MIGDRKRGWNESHRGVGRPCRLAFAPCACGDHRRRGRLHDDHLLHRPPANLFDDDENAAIIGRREETLPEKLRPAIALKPNHAPVNLNINVDLVNKLAEDVIGDRDGGSAKGLATGDREDKAALATWRIDTKNEPKGMRDITT